MRLRFILILIFLILFSFYLYEYHQDEYQTALSYVAKSAKNIHTQVRGPVVDLTEQTTEAATDHPVISSILDNVLGNDAPLSTNQHDVMKRLSMKCLEASKVPESEYHHSLNSPLEFFTKYDDKYRFLYCSVPKVASTNWKRTMIVLSMSEAARAQLTRDDVNSLKNVHNDPRIKSLYKLNTSPFYPPYTEYYKFVLFRHPFTRMVSAWRNKLQLVDGKVNNYFYEHFGLPIIRLTRGAKGEMRFNKNQKENLVTFKEFVTGIKHGIVDRHWMSQTELCQPCDLRYNYIGFFEHLSEDTNLILEQIGVLDDVIKADKISSAGLKYSTTDATRDLFNNDLTPQDVEDMYQFYKKDFILLGYNKDVNSPNFPYPNLNSGLL